MRKYIKLLAIALIISCSFAVIVKADTASEENEAGKTGICCDGLTWTYYDDTLYFEGNGVLYKDSSYDMPDIRNVVIYPGITAIEDETFMQSELLKNVILPSSIIRIGKNAFSYSMASVNVSAPERGLEEIGDYAFKYAGLQGFNLPETVRKIGRYAFTGCDIQVLTIPENTTEIGEGAFSATEVSYVEMYCKADVIKEYTFSSCKNLEYVLLSKSVREIRDFAFQNCPNLRSITVARGTRISEKAFEGNDTKPEINYLEFDDVHKTDIKEGIHKSVYWAADNLLIKGYDDNTFRPDEHCTREQFVTILWRMEGKPSASAAGKAFIDVEESRSTAKAITWAAANGIVSGYNDGTFRPEEPVTRQQIAIILWRMLGKPQAGAAKAFSDVHPGISGYNAILWASSAGLVNGYSDGRFGISESCTRAQLVIILYRGIEKQELLKLAA